MCFISEDTTCYLATEDIVCYKVVRRTLFPFYYRSIWRKIPYYPGIRLPHVIINPIYSSSESIRIEEGYHSYITEEEARNIKKVHDGWDGWPKTWDSWPKTKILKFIIPKGTYYYIDPIDKEYVSEDLKIK